MHREQRRDLDRSRRFDAFAPRDGECAALVRDGDSARALGAVAANAFRSAESFIAKLRSRMRASRTAISISHATPKTMSL